MVHACNCGQHFSLRVELALHCEATGHMVASSQPAPMVCKRDRTEQLEAAAAPVVQSFVARQPQPTGLLRRNAKPLAATLVLASLLTFNVVVSKTMGCYAAWQGKAFTQLVLP